MSLPDRPAAGLTRRSLFLGGFGGVGLLALAACGSGGSDSASGAASGSTPVSGGSLTVGLSRAADMLDPNVASSGSAFTIMRGIFDSLVYEDADHQFHPWLAEKWDISADATEYTFHLKSNVKFHDGTDFDAAAVKTNFDRIVDPATASQYASSLLGTYASATVVDAQTLKVKLSKPYAPLLDGLSTAYLGIQSPAAIKKYGKDVATHPVGTGPFKFVSSVTEKEYVLAKNADYAWAWTGAGHTSAPYLDKLTFKVVATDAARLGALKSGELDAVEAIPADQRVAFGKDTSLKVDVHNAVGSTYSLYLNQKVAPWDQQEARVALRSGIDIPAILKTLYFGQYQQAWSVLSPQVEGYDKTLENSWKFDAAAAKSGFESLGYTLGADGYYAKDGTTLSVAMVNDSSVGDKRLEIDTILEQQLKAVGVKMNIQHVEFNTYASLTENQKYGMESFQISTGDASVLDTIFNSKNVSSPGIFQYNVANYINKDFDALGAQAPSTVDAAKRNEIYAQMQQMVNSSASAIPIYVSQLTFALKKKVNGTSYDARSFAQFYDTWISA
jgi:peptide/nickel transport system substrate-binding protein